MNKEPIRLICRNSKLSVIQAGEVMQHFPGVKFEVQAIQSYGDKHREIILTENIDADFFTRELDLALLNNEADIAVHSAKDLPYPLPEGLELIALTPAEYIHDVLISRNKLPLTEMPAGSKIGTSSQMRKEQVHRVRPDLVVTDIRGTIEERLALIDTGVIDVLIVAECAIHRLKLSHLITEVLPFQPHSLQGKLAVIARKGNTNLQVLFFRIDERPRYGKVILAGAGPGDEGLLTQAAGKELQRADVVLYDALVGTSLIASIACNKIYTGKRKGKHDMKQEQINQLLYRYALEGKRVVRLKGGDPFIFGRGEEEFDFLRSRFIEVNVLPGITSAFAAAAKLGFSFTHRGKASSVAFCTGYPIDKIQTPDADTLVYYMGAENLRQIAGKLIASGKSGSTPVVLISNISTPAEEIRFSTLADILAQENIVPTPLLFITGNVVQNKNFPNRIRNRKKVLVTGTRSERYAHLGEIIHTPLIEAIPPESYQFLSPVLNAKCSSDTIIFTSRNAVHYFFIALREFGHDVRWTAGLKIVSVGKVTSKAIRNFGLEPDFQASEESARGILKLLRTEMHDVRKILIPCSDLAGNYLSAELKNDGYQVTSLCVYRNVLPASYRKIDLEKIDIITFSSPSGIENFRKIYGLLPSGIQVITIGDTTQKALQNSGLKEPADNNLNDHKNNLIQ